MKFNFWPLQLSSGWLFNFQKRIQLLVKLMSLVCTFTIFPLLLLSGLCGHTDRQKYGLTFSVLIIRKSDTAAMLGYLSYVSGPLDTKGKHIIVYSHLSVTIYMLIWPTLTMGGVVGGLKYDMTRCVLVVACLLHQACQAGRGASLQVKCGRPVPAVI